MLYNFCVWWLWSIFHKTRTYESTQRDRKLWNVIFEHTAHRPCKIQTCSGSPSATGSDDRQRGAESNIWEEFKKKDVKNCTDSSGGWQMCAFPCISLGGLGRRRHVADHVAVGKPQAMLLRNIRYVWLQHVSNMCETCRGSHRLRCKGTVCEFGYAQVVVHLLNENEVNDG